MADHKIDVHNTTSNLPSNSSTGSDMLRCGGIISDDKFIRN